MADQKISALTALTGADVDPAVDVFPIVDTGSTTTKKITVTEAKVLGQVSKSINYTLVLGDAFKHIFHPTADDNARMFTIPANASVAYPVGTTITFVNQINTLVIAITTDTLTLLGPGSTGSRTLAANGIATILKVGSTSWIINGVNLS